MKNIFQELRLVGRLSATALLVCVMSQVADAQLIAYEGFDYYNPANTSTFPGPADGSLNGGSGWNGGWVSRNGPPVADERIVESGLTYTDSNGDTLQSNSGSLEQYDNYLGTPIRFIDISGIGDPGLLINNASDLGAYGTSLWISFLGKGVPEDDDGSSIAGFTIRNIDGRKSVLFGRPQNLQLDGTRADTQESWGIIRHDDGTPNPDVDLTAGVSSTDGSTIFMVARLDFLGTADQAFLGPGNFGTNISAWINPDLDSEPLPSDPSNFVDALNTWEVAFSRIEMGGNTDTFFDEFRIGTSYADVAPIGAPVGQPSDFDNDNDVDGADFLIWQRNLGDVSNLTDWESNYGDASAVSAVAVPEPVSWLLAVGMAIAMALSKRRIAGEK